MIESLKRTMVLLLFILLAMAAGTATAETDFAVPQELATIPDSYYSPSDQPGTLVDFYYDTYESMTYEHKTQVLTKHAIVYLPYGYDESQPYNIFYLMHGGWSNETTTLGTPDNPTAFKHVIDHAITAGEIAPLIIVCPTYNNTSLEDSGNFGLALRLNQNYHNELLNDLIPAVESVYPTYARSASPEDLAAARDHRGFGGFSMGSVATWRTFQYGLDYFRYFLPMSCGTTLDDETIFAAAEGREPGDYFVWIITGTSDFAYGYDEDRVAAMRRSPYFIDETEGQNFNFAYRVKEGYAHDGRAAMEYTYNGLRLFWPYEGETIGHKASEPYTVDSLISEVTSDPAFGDYGRLIFPVNSGYYSGSTLRELRLTWYNVIDPSKTVEIVNYMKEHAEAGDAIFFDIYTDAEKKADPAKRDTGLFFFKGNPGARFAICNAGGGFAYVGAMHDSFPHALELSKMGYNAFALIYRPDAQAACEDLARAIRFIFDNAGELQINTDRYSLWGGILRAPVPAAMTPQVKLQGTGKAIYKVSTSRNPLRLRSGIGTKYRVLGKYKKGTQVIVLSTANSSWYEVSCPDGKRGYMASEYLTYVRTEATSGQAAKAVIESRQLRDQPFRIYRAVPELTKITVYARHVFYDLMDNMLKSYKPAASTAGSVVVQNISSKCLTEHDFTFYSDLTSTADEVEFENMNPVDALLGEGGVVEKYGGELARDWFDAFVVKRVGTDTDVQIREGKNLLGISYDVDLTDVVTRIMPTGEDADGNVLYLPELYIDSPNIGSYVHPKWIHLPVSEAREVTKGDDKKTKAQCYTEMRKAAQAEYGKGCDLPTVTLKVDFINCAETEEYRQYRFLQNIFLGDAVRVIARRIGVAVSMRLTQYTYDCLTRKYTAMTLGTVADSIEGNTISSRQLASGTVTGTKLAINSVGAGQLKNGSVGSLQIGLAAIQSAHIQEAAIINALIADAAITRAKIEEATIGTLNADAITAISARIQELAAGSVTTDALYAALATIATAQITTANIENANISWADIGALAAQMAGIAVAQINTATINQAFIDWANISNLNTRIAQVALAQITSANIESAHIDWANIADLNAAIAHIAVAQLTTAHLHEAHIDWASITALNTTIAQMVNASIGSADIDWASIKDLTAGTAIIERGVNGKLYVADLAVTEANMASLTVGELIVRGNDGCFYAVSIAADGSIITEKKSVTGSDVADGSLPGGKLLEDAITARELNVASIFADEALVRAIKAANLDVDDLFAHTAFIAKLRTVDITGNEALRLYVESEVSAAKDEALDAVGDAVSQITLTADAIRSEVSRDYASAGALTSLKNTVSTLAEQTENKFTWATSKVTEIEQDLAEGQEATDEQIALIKTYMTFGDDGLIIGKSGNPITIRVVNDRVAFYMNNTQVAYLSNNKLYVTQAEILTRLQIGKFAYEPQANGNLSMIYTG